MTLTISVDIGNSRFWAFHSHARPMLHLPGLGRDQQYHLRAWGSLRVKWSPVKMLKYWPNLRIRYQPPGWGSSGFWCSGPLDCSNQSMKHYLSGKIRYENKSGSIWCFKLGIRWLRTLMTINIVFDLTRPRIEGFSGSRTPRLWKVESRFCSSWSYLLPKRNLDGIHAFR